MKGPTTAADLEPSHRLAKRPVDARRKLPIPAVSIHLPEDRAYDSESLVVSIDHPHALVKWDAIYAPAVFTLGKEKRCALCTEPFDTFPAFLGGPSTVRTGHYNDGPMHVECAHASLTLCPHLRLGHHRRSSESRAQGINERSERMFLTLVTGYSIALGEDSMHFVVEPKHVLDTLAFHYVNGEIEPEPIGRRDGR